jgi:membrane-associated phospholipid phosphatase
MRVAQAASSTPTAPEWFKGGALVGGAVLASALLDKPVQRFVANQHNNTLMRTWGNVGKGMPIVLAGAGAAAFAFGEERMQNIGLISMESVLSSVGVATGIKYVVGRARPAEGQGPWSQTVSGRSNASFPSGHSAVAFAAVTPFAQEYDAPWLYGVAAFSAAGRVAGNQHWVSDTVAGSLVGYVIGSWLWQSQRENRMSSVSVNPGPKAISVAWRGSY